MRELLGLGRDPGPVYRDVPMSYRDLADLVRSTFGTSTFIDGISYEGHSNVGFGGGEDWWHYWTKADEASPWVASLIGASDRVVTSGAWDGWVYGSDLPPAVPEPPSHRTVCPRRASRARQAVSTSPGGLCVWRCCAMTPLGPTR